MCDSKYPEVQAIIRSYIRDCEITVRQLSVALHPIKEARIYDWIEGRRTMDGWEYEIWLQRTGKHINYKDLRGETPCGMVKKSHGSQLVFEDLRRIKP